MYFVEKSNEKKYFKKLDYILLIPVMILTIIGFFAVNSAAYTMSGGSKIVLMQGIGIVLGLIFMFIIGYIDYKDLKILGLIIYGVSIGLLILVLVIGDEQSGSRSWLSIVGVSFQPAEIAKISFIIMAGSFLDKMRDSEWLDIVNIFKLTLISGVPIVLVLLQKDYGTALVFFVILFVLLFVYGIKYRYFLILGAIGSVGAILSWIFVLNEARKNRIRVFLDPQMDPLGAGYNVISSKRTIGSGQIFGKGLFQGIQTQNGGVPVKESDFIFSVIGEELGFIGAIIVIGIILFLLLRCMYIANVSRDNFGAFIVSGITGMYAAHFIENIGMTIGLVPVTGIPLPFVSAGGSAILTNFIGLGIILSVSIRRKKELFK